MTAREVIDRINDEIVKIVSHYVELKQSGANLKGCCPFHQEKTPSFMVSPAKGIFKCFGCGKGGNAITFIMEHDQLGFKEAVTKATKILNLEFKWSEVKDFNEKEYKHQEALSVVCAAAMDYFAQQLEESPQAKKYITERGYKLSDDFAVGYAQGGNKFIEWSKKSGYDENLLIEAGLIARNDSGELYDFFRERIIFPICEKTGRVVGFTGRILDDSKKTSKYVNTQETPIFKKGELLFGLNMARMEIRKENRAFLVEGNFDVWRMHQIGVYNTIAPCGTALTLEQVRLLKSITKNVTLIYDGDNAGRKAIERNGELLVKEQMNVMVVCLPDDADPDNYFADKEAFEALCEDPEDFIIYKVRKNQKRCANPAYKSEFIKDMAGLIANYDDQYHEVYIEAVSKMIKPKKAWQDQIRMFQADKGPTEKKVYIPKTVSADEFVALGFYAENNCYYFADQKGMPHQRSNFVLSPLFHIDSTINAKRLYEVSNCNNQVRVIEIPQRDLVSLSAFQVHIESLGNFWFDGSQADLNRLKRWLYEKTESCKEITQLGWQKEGFFAWGNGIYNDEFTPVDSYGIVKHGQQSYYIPAFSSIYTKEDNLYCFERRFIHMEGNITLKEYAKKFISVFGDNARVALCYYIACLFRDIIVARFGFFPILNMFGPKGAGKTACAESLVQFFGRLMKAPNLNNTSKPALADHVATSVNALCHIDEYRNDIDVEKREFLKGLWDGIGRTRMNMDKDKKKESTSVDQGIVLTGQQMATADIALFSRFIFLSFTQTEYTDEERERFNSLKEVEKRGLTHITHAILKFRGLFKDNFVETVQATSDRMREALGGIVVEDRIFNNWLIPISAYITLADVLEVWDPQEIIVMGVRLMIRQNQETKKNDDLGNFWRSVQYLASSNLLFEGGDYKIEIVREFKRRYYESGKWMEEVVNFSTPEQILYLQTSRVFSLYKSQCLKEGDKPLPESTIEYYLKNSSAFICETKKESFRKINTKTGMQEIDELGNKKRTSTTALVFKLNYLNITMNATEEETNTDKEVEDVEFPPHYKAVYGRRDTALPF